MFIKVQQSLLKLRLVLCCCLLASAFNLASSMWIIDHQTYSTLVGNAISLPCNITPPTSDDGVSLILWYREDLATPIYTVDSRSTIQLHAAKHFFDSNVLSNRATFNLTHPVSYLQFNPSVETDTAEYRCRVDFRRGRTINRVMHLNVIVPPTKVSIIDAFGNRVNDIAGPFNEDAQLNITCLSKGGHPLPSIKWWKGDQLLSDQVKVINKQNVHNVLQLPKLLREHLMMPLTCEVSNTNLTSPVTRTILVDLNLKPTNVKIIEPLANMTIGERVELVCQSSGSRPPAKISWRKEKTQLEHVSESTSDDGTVTTNFLTFVPTIDDNGKVLTCAAFNPQFNHFQIEDKLALNIHYSPILSLLLGASVQRQEIIEDTNVYFDCNIQANPMIHDFGWLWNGNELQEESIKDKSRVIRNNSIVISNVSKHHSGQYQCWAGNSLGKATSEVVNLDVKYSPVCTTMEATFLHAMPYEQLTIHCEVEANPDDVEFFWEFNTSDTKRQEGNNKNDVSGQPEPIMTINNWKLTSELRFTPKSQSDFGVVYCYARNRIGQQREPCVFYISRSEVPEAPENCSLANITTTSLVVQCSTQKYFDSSKLYVLEIYNDQNILLRNISTDLGGAYFNATSLPPGYSFNLVLYALNANGISDQVRLVANTLVGEPRKLEHIEQKMTTKPVLVLLTLLVAMLVLGLVLLFVFARLRHRTKCNRQSRDSCRAFDTDNIEAVSKTTKKQKTAAATITTIQPTTTTAAPVDVSTNSLPSPHAAAKPELNVYKTLPVRSEQNGDRDRNRPLSAAAIVSNPSGILTLDRLTPETYNDNANMLSCMATSDDHQDMLAVNSYLELTNLSTLLNDAGESYSYLDQGSHHVSLCNDLPALSNYLQYVPSSMEHVHMPIKDSAKSPASNCLLMEANSVLFESDKASPAKNQNCLGHTQIPCVLLNNDGGVYFQGPRDVSSSTLLSDLNRSFLESGVDVIPFSTSHENAMGGQFAYELSCSHSLSLADGSTCDQSPSSPSAASSSSSANQAKAALKVRFCE